MEHEDNEENSSYISSNESLETKSKIDFINFIGYPFNFIENSEINEDINEYQRFYSDNLNNSPNSCDKSSPLVVNSTFKNKFIILNKKRGREKTKNISNTKKVKIHNKFSDDNIIRKCQVSYINFIIKFMNILCSKFNINLTFIKIDNKFKKVVNKKNIKKLIFQTIEEIIKNNISPKYSTKDKSINKKNCEIIRKKGLTDFINILNKKFLFFFDKIYYTSKRKFNLRQFNLADIEIELPDDLELYENLLNKNRKDRNFNEYKEKMEKIIKNYFLPKVNGYFFECH